MLSKIKVYGRLARFIGERTFEAEVNSPIEAFKFLIANFPKLESHILQQNYCVKVGDYEINEKEMDIPVGSQEIKIVPVAVGAGRGFGRFLGGLLVVGLVMATGGAAGVSLGAGGGLGFGTAAGAGFGAKLLAAAGNFGIYMALSGAAEMISPTPRPPGISDDPQQLNFSFSGVQNTVRSGTAIPVIYGKMLVGSIPVSTKIQTNDIEA